MEVETIKKEVGVIQNWNYKRFGDLFDYENKSKIKAGDGLASGSYPFYTSSVELTKFIDECNTPQLLGQKDGSAKLII